MSRLFSNTIPKFTLILLFLVLQSSIALAQSSKEAMANNQVNIVVGCLFLLVFIKIIIASIIGYLWYRKSKFRKEKIILEV